MGSFPHKKTKKKKKEEKKKERKKRINNNKEEQQQQEQDVRCWRCFNYMSNNKTNRVSCDS